MSRIIYDSDDGNILPNNNMSEGVKETKITAVIQKRKRKRIITSDDEESISESKKEDADEKKSSNTSQSVLSRENSTSTNSLSSSYSSDYASENLSDLGCNLNDILPKNKKRQAANNGLSHRLTKESENGDLNEIIDNGMGTSSNVPDRKTKAGTIRKESTRCKEESGTDSDSDSLDGFIVDDDDIE